MKNIISIPNAPLCGAIRMFFFVFCIFLVFLQMDNLYLFCNCLLILSFLQKPRPCCFVIFLPILTFLQKPRPCETTNILRQFGGSLGHSGRTFWKFGYNLVEHSKNFLTSIFFFKFLFKILLKIFWRQGMPKFF